MTRSKKAPGYWWCLIEEQEHVQSRKRHAKETCEKRHGQCSSWPRKAANEEATPPPPRAPPSQQLRGVVVSITLCVASDRRHEWVTWHRQHPDDLVLCGNTLGRAIVITTQECCWQPPHPLSSRYHHPSPREEDNPPPPRQWTPHMPLAPHSSHPTSTLC